VKIYARGSSRPSEKVYPTLRRLAFSTLVSPSSVKRYVRIANRGESLKPRKGGGRPPKTDQTIEKLLEDDLQERPAATIEERRRFLKHLTSKTMSASTVRRLLRHLGFNRKKDCSNGGTGRVSAGGLEGDGPREGRS
jgi:transposase